MLTKNVRTWYNIKVNYKYRIRIDTMKKLLGLTLLFFSGFIMLACGGEEDDTTLDTNYTDELEFDVDYEGKSFIDDGVGEVILTQCVDGDTFRFREPGGTETYPVRFIGVDTPETYPPRDDPWGQAASDHTCIALANAETIVLEWDSAVGSRKETYGRWLAFVWYDGRLLNLELVELAYSSSSAMGTRYGDIMQTAWYEAINTGRRIHGEDDPSFE